MLDIARTSSATAADDDFVQSKLPNLRVAGDRVREQLSKAPSNDTIDEETKELSTIDVSDEDCLIAGIKLIGRDRGGGGGGGMDWA